MWSKEEGKVDPGQWVRQLGTRGTHEGKRAGGRTCNHAEDEIKIVLLLLRMTMGSLV